MVCLRCCKRTKYLDAKYPWEHGTIYYSYRIAVKTKQTYKNNVPMIRPEGLRRGLENGAGKLWRLSWLPQFHWLVFCISLFLVSLYADISMYLRDVRLTDYGIILQFYFRSKSGIFEICRHFCGLLSLFLLVTCNVSFCNRNNFVLLFQWLKDNA